ncbi:MAG TPA: alpha/beta hydrolase [Candidatus Acidoferrum sp.]|nr:alpha/beta hydrolase [Candidatus Acidoferrum sp.]
MPSKRDVDVGDARSEFLLEGRSERSGCAAPEHGHAFHERLGRRIHVADIPDAGHMVFLEQPEAVASVVVSFLRQQAA